MLLYKKLLLMTFGTTLVHIVDLINAWRVEHIKIVVLCVLHSVTKEESSNTHQSYFFLHCLTLMMEAVCHSKTSVTTYQSS